MQEPQYLSLPEKSGVYIFKDEKEEILYIGKALNLQKRAKSYFVPLSLLGQKTKKVEHIQVESEFEALLLEAHLIKKYQPKYNNRLKDDKSPLYIKITYEAFPQVFPARKSIGGFGPYPSAKIVRSVLKTLRRIFPYRSCPQLPKKPCLYFDLKLCPGVCLNQLEDKKKEYQKTISLLEDLLSQKSLKVISDLKKEMKKAAKEENFSLAKDFRDKIFQIEWLIQKHHLPDEYLEKPDLLSDLRQKELFDLGRILKINSSLERIEGFDVSNISGTKSTGGMVVFINGEGDKSLYRRFRIRMKETPNDVAMVKEVILRRIKHLEWEFPNLMVIDGGKGQAGGVIEVLKKEGLDIPVIGLAKRLEEIVLKTEKGKWKVEKLPNDSPALNLLKRIRDEAHRFARAYHLKLRRII